MIKDIVASLSVGNDGPAGDYAVALAAAFSARLTGVAFVFDPVVPISGTGYIPAEIVESQQADNQAAAKNALDRFVTAANRAGLAAEPLSLTAGLAGAGDQFARLARAFDLAVVGQADPETGGAVENIVAETTLFESGRPVVMVPYIQKAPFKLDSVMVCWDGSRQAARAVADAMPLMQKAGNVEIVIITNERGKEEEIEGADIGQHLARHDITVDVHRIAGGNIDIADALLSHAADSAADLMVMGGYGHSRLREFILGGVTNSIFKSMTVPTLMAH